MLAAIALSFVASFGTVTLEFIEEGGMLSRSGYDPQHLELSPNVPVGLNRAPQAQSPLYGVLKFGKAGSKKNYYVMIGDKGALYVDSNGNGDLLDDRMPQWRSYLHESSEGKEYTQFTGSFRIQHVIGGVTRNISIGTYRFDPTDPKRSNLKNVLMVYCDYYYKGKSTFGDQTLSFQLYDRYLTGDFQEPRLNLLIDRNSDNRYKETYEYFNAHEPFNIRGKTYVMDLGSAQVGTVSISPSTSYVEERVPTRDLSIGKLAIRNRATALDGEPIDFPRDYGRKIVMLHFWATSSRASITDIKYIKQAYKQYANQGFDVISISADTREVTQNDLRLYAQTSEMTWRHIYNRYGWDAYLLKRYCIQKVPVSILVDAATMKIVSSPDSLHGPNIAREVARVLAAKKRGG